MALDKAPALEALQLSEPELDDLLREFVELAEVEVDSIRGRLDGKRFDGLDRRAHSIRGMAANLRLDLCRNRASRLEAALTSHDANRAAEAMLFLEQAIDEVRRAAMRG